jgi:uncharacterized membrane-anchored protein
MQLRNKEILLFAVVLQLLVLAGMFVKALHPLLTGQEVELMVHSKDPRNLLRGNYVRLNYDFNQVALDYVKNDIGDPEQYRYGDVLYAELAQYDDGTWYTKGLWKSPPDNGNPYLRTIAQGNAYGNQVYLKAGIEEYFMEKDEAILLDQLMAARVEGEVHVTVTVRVTQSGVARIEKINYPEPVE